jgi:MoaA/NifB/PqqE/SkfB family radical SAM enzyme
MYHTFDSVIDMHVEITNRCNAACPMCARNNFGGKTKDDLVLDEWSTGDIDLIFRSQFPNLQNVMFCGTHGDPCVAENTIYAINRIKSTTDATVEFYSNASMRTKQWWSDLGKLLNQKKPDHAHYRKNDLAIFSIDGLEDTNRLYRRNTNFQKIIENAQAFIDAGGIARWDFIVFKHNEHQVETARDLARRLGFKQFRIRRTSRFDYSPDGPDKWRVYDKDGNIEYYLEPPSTEYRNPESDVFAGLVETHGSIKNYFNIAKINCLYKNNFKRLYVNAYAEVYPCCFVGNDRYGGGSEIVADTTKKVFEKYEHGFNSLRERSWEEILTHPWLANDLMEGWNTDLDGGKLMRCSRTCGTEYNPIKSQSKDINLQS